MHLAEALPFEFGIANRQHLVDDENLRLKMCCHRKCQPYIHSTAVAFDRRIEETLHFGEVDNLVEFCFDLSPRHAEDGTVEIDVLASREFGVEASADL